MSRYLLTIVESVGKHEFLTNHVIEAEDRQMVKYHFHRTLKDWGYADMPQSSNFDKHYLHRGRLDAKIHEIRELDDIEYDVLKDHTRHWTKV